MASFIQSLLCGSLGTILVLFPLSASAQTETGEFSQEVETSPSLWLEPRFHIDYNSSGGGYDGFGGLEIFLPIQQEPGSDIRYLVGRVNLTNNTDVGGNLLLGSRSVDECWIVSGECLFGGYLGFDFTDTGESFFPQFGVGLEMLGDLDLRLNGYMPLGNTSQIVEGGFVSPTGIAFQGNNLLFLDANHFGRAEVALNGFDAEIGAKLIDFGNGGDLRAYGGVYNYGGEDVDRFWGGRFRLVARPTDFLSLSGGVQFDEEFGTNLLFQVSASIPSHPQASEVESPSVYARMTDPLGRLNSVVVTEQAVAATEIAVDPTTGEPLVFIHVDPNNGNSSGTYEDPYRTIAAATAATTPATDVIYVQPGNAGGGFTIPEGIAVLSVAPVQVMATQFGPVQLPGSGQGEAARPLITDTVTIGNNTVISGFQIAVDEGAAITSEGFLQNSYVTISDNVISSPDRGIDISDCRFSDEPYEGRYSTRCKNLSNDPNNIVITTIADNDVTGSVRTDSCRFIDQTVYACSGFTASVLNNIVQGDIDISSAGYTILSNTVSDGDIFALYDGDILGNIVINGSIRAHGNSWYIYFPATGEFYEPVRSGDIVGNHVTNGNINAFYLGEIVGNTVNNGDIHGKGGTLISNNLINDGYVSITGSGVAIGNTITTSMDNQSAIVAYPYVGRFGQVSSGDFNIAGNTVITSGESANGIFVRASDGWSTSGNDIIIVSGNTVITSGDNADGIVVENSNYYPGDDTLVVSGNTVTTNGDNADGILVETGTGRGFFGGADGSKIKITDNQITYSGQEGIRLVRLAWDDSGVCAWVDNNVSRQSSVSSSSGFGYHFINPAGGTFQVVDSSPAFADTQANNIGTFFFEPDISSFTNVSACPQN